MRMRPYEAQEIRDDVNALVIRDFLPAIAAIEGFKGYLVGDVLHDPHLTFGVPSSRTRKRSPVPMTSRRTSLPKPPEHRSGHFRA